MKKLIQTVEITFFVSDDYEITNEETVELTTNACLYNANGSLLSLSKRVSSINTEYYEES
jgi:hypothetical protein